MGKPSLDLTTQLDQLLKQAAIAEQTVQHRNAELLVVQEKINQLQTKFDVETTRLLADQTEILLKVREPIEKEIQASKDELVVLRQDIALLVQERDLLDKYINVNQVDLHKSRETVTALNNTAQEVKSEVDRTNQIIVNLNADKTATELRISELSSEENRLKTSIATCQDTFVEWQQRIDNAEADYTARTADKEATVKLLDAKILKVTQELEERQRIEASTRDELAKMQRTLSERDQNLRIREAKVEQGETKLVQNANLMSL
jgi:chromosome segregation ATPase